MASSFLGRIVPKGTVKARLILFAMTLLLPALLVAGLALAKLSALQEQVEALKVPGIEAVQSDLGTARL